MYSAQNSVSWALLFVDLPFASSSAPRPSLLLPPAHLVTLIPQVNIPAKWNPSKEAE